MNLISTYAFINLILFLLIEINQWGVANDAGYTLFIQAFIAAGSVVNLGLAIWKLILWTKFRTSSSPLVPLSLGLLIIGNTGMHF